MTKIETLLLSSQTVFSVADLSLYWNEPDRKKLWESIKYYLRIGKLQKLRSGMYSLRDGYEELELAVKLFSPAYISFHTALGIHGISFQQYGAVHVVGSLSKKIVVRDTEFICHQVKDAVLFASMGVLQERQYSIASSERAVCDSLYLSPKMTFDRIENLNSEKLLATATIYENKSLISRVQLLLAGG